MAVTKPEINADELRAACDDLVDEIVNGDDSLWEAYAERMAHESAAGFRIGLFKIWSANNRFYLMSQAKKRSQRVQGLYAGVDQWRKRGRFVREGEVPFVIYGPPTYLRRDDQQNPAQNANVPAATQPATQPQPAAPAVAQLRFRRPPIIAVYDYTQTACDDPDYEEPNWAAPLAGGDFDTLAKLTNSSPVPVSFRNVASKIENGWLDATGITIDATQPVTNQISTLAHELAHHYLGHLDRLTTTARHRSHAEEQEADDARAVCEQEAALTQFFVMKMLGLDESVGADITKAAGTYLRSWNKRNGAGDLIEIAGHKGRRKLVRERFDIAFRAAQAIITAYAQDEPAQAA